MFVDVFKSEDSGPFFLRCRCILLLDELDEPVRRDSAAAPTSSHLPLSFSDEGAFKEKQE